jgi:MerR HTH family regulatory protein
VSRRRQRVMPLELVRALRRARRVELAAHGRARAHAHATCRALMRAAVDAGWQAEEIAHVVAMAGGTVRQRVATDRARHPQTPTGFDVPAAPMPPARPWDFITTPAADRDLLTRREALTFAGCSPDTLRSWWRAGLLPNTRQVNQTRRAYSRTDLQRILDVLAYHNRGHDHTAIHAAIRAEIHTEVHAGNRAAVHARDPM